MAVESIEVQRPDRWDHPLSGDMTQDQLDQLLRSPPFSLMDASRFARNASLADILRNDTRLIQCEPGDLVFREGQYGGTAYLVLHGDVRIFLSQLIPEASPRAISRWSGKRWLKFFRGQRGKQAAGTDRRKTPRREAGRPESASSGRVAFGYRGSGTETRIFLQDVPGVLSEHSTSQVGAGELFGEMAAVTRSPREFTAVAATRCALLEIRWQGLKLLKQDTAFRNLLDERYRSEVLHTHLRETKLFRYIPDDSIEQIVASAKLESFGNLEWYAEYRKGSKKSASQQIAAEPLIAEEGAYATGLWIIRGGFARLSRRQGAGHRTLAYLGKGQIFGLSELAHNFRSSSGAAPLPYQESLRAIGYVDALCIPKQIVNQHVLPYVRRADLPPRLDAPRYQFGQPVIDAPLELDANTVDTGLLEFLVEQRLMNGRRAMVIDTDRCTRCDDCVKACATTHGGTPVFQRKGPQYNNWMFTESCMHCEDPVCMIGCPTGAIHRDHESGLVKINDSTCIGCKSCAESCPYSNIRMVTAQDSRGRAKVDRSSGLPILQASKCDFCSERSGRPACQSACPHNALFRIDMSDIKIVNQHMSGK
ncbi:MAG: cyclic nucleotide-binding domain-containing protein [Planctomycetales bacterium]|nr:cyclic nucleotide-binding domain-containing protein [Planctomycetales bacterium]